jgi:hypothetical protein
MNGKQVAFAATIEYLELPEEARNYMNEHIPLTLLLKRYLLLIVIRGHLRNRNLC